MNSVPVGLRRDPDASENELDVAKRTLDNMKHCDSDIMNNKNGDVSGSDSSPSRGDPRLSEGSPSGAWGSGDEDKQDRVRVIGELPIAEYEGSPRRYGVGSQLNVNMTRSPRPGFPQVSLLSLRLAYKSDTQVLVLSSVIGRIWKF